MHLMARGATYVEYLLGSVLHRSQPLIQYDIDIPKAADGLVFWLQLILNKNWTFENLKIKLEV